jgi:TctA family transporter
MILLANLGDDVLSALAGFLSGLLGLIPQLHGFDAFAGAFRTAWTAVRPGLDQLNYWIGLDWLMSALGFFATVEVARIVWRGIKLAYDMLPFFGHAH